MDACGGVQGCVRARECARARGCGCPCAGFPQIFGVTHTHPHKHSHTHTHAFTTQGRPVPQNAQRHGPHPPRSKPRPPNSPFAHACRDTHAISAAPVSLARSGVSVLEQPGPPSTTCVWVTLAATTAARFQQGYPTRAHIHDCNTRTGVLQSCVCVCVCVHVYVRARVVPRAIPTATGDPPACS